MITLPAAALFLTLFPTSPARAEPAKIAEPAKAEKPAAPAKRKKKEKIPAPAPVKVGGESSPCAAEAEKHCPGLEPSSERYGNCLRGLGEKLSQGCGDWLKEHALQSSGGLGACSEDAKRLCPQFEKGGDTGGKLLECMRAKAAEASEGCRAKISGAKREPGR